MRSPKKTSKGTPKNLNIRLIYILDEQTTGKITIADAKEVLSAYQIASEDTLHQVEYQTQCLLKFSAFLKEKKLSGTKIFDKLLLPMQNDPFFDLGQSLEQLYKEKAQQELQEKEEETVVIQEDYEYYQEKNKDKKKVDSWQENVLNNEEEGEVYVVPHEICDFFEKFSQEFKDREVFAILEYFTKQSKVRITRSFFCE